MLLTLASLALALELVLPDEIVADGAHTARVEGAVPGQTLVLVAGDGPGATCVGPVCPDLANPRILARGTANRNGNATLRFRGLDPAWVGSELFLQALTTAEATPVASRTLLADADGDNYGDGGLDCDDGDPSVHAGAKDLVADGIDQNCNGEDAPHWSYEAPDGPDDWGSLGVDYATCSAGTEQSPVDVPALVTGAALTPLALTSCETGVSIVNNGHTIEYEVEAEAGPCVYRLGGTDYKLVQFHFHSPSEHTFDGLPADLEVHMVHASKDGELAVIGLPMVGTQGSGFAPLDAIAWDQIPVDAHEEYVDPLLTFDPYELLDRANLGEERWRYEGSLTTPPCTEGVRWTVLTNPAEVSVDQLDVFQSIYDLNARPTQPLNGRNLTGYDAP